MQANSISETKRTRILNGFFLLFCFVILLRYFAPTLPLDVPAAALLLLLVAITFKSLDRGSMLIFGTLGLIGVVCMILCRASLADWTEAILSNAQLIILLLMVPFISSPFQYDDYDSQLALFVKKNMKGLMGFLLLTGLINHVFSVCIGIGAVLITYSLLSPYAKLYNGDDAFMVTVSRSYNASGFWSPAWGSVIVFSAVEEASWLRTVPMGLLYTAIFFGIHYLLVFWEIRRHPARYPSISSDARVQPDQKKLRTLVLLMTGMIISIMLLNALTGWDLMITVCICAILFPSAACLIMHKPDGFQRGVELYFKKQLPGTYSQAALFLFSGFFGTALSKAGLGAKLVSLLPKAFSTFPPLMLACLMLIMILPAMLGIHPAATGSALIAAVTPVQLGLAPYSYVLAILTGWLIGIMMCPYCATGLMLSKLTGKSSYKTTIGINKWFSLICVIVFSLLSAWIGPLMN